MRQSVSPTLVYWLSRLLIVCFALAFALAGVSNAHGVDTDKKLAASLHAKYQLLQDKLHNSQFQKPLHLDSSEKSGTVAGDMYALIDHSFATVSTALHVPTHWCDILILHLNTKYCHVSATSQGTVLNVNIGKKYDQPLDETYRVNFDYQVATKTPNYLQVKLNADKGPISTRNYSIMLEAIPLENGRTFIHLAYSYAYGFAGQVAMQAYFSTIGSDKVGFTVMDKDSEGQPVYIGGMRGLVERNTMRYYLAIEAFLGALSSPPQAQLEKRLLDWFTAIERYPRQLHEMERSEYLEMKRKEYLRQHSESPTATASE